MRCPDCGFENRDGEERCFRCRAYLLQLEEGQVVPPRKSANIIAGWIYNIDNAWRRIDYRWGLHRIRLPRLYWHPVFPALASLIVPGSGQVLNGRPWKAVFFLGAYAMVLIISFYQWYGGLRITIPLFWAFMAHIVNLPYYVAVIHSWIVFDAYNDSVRILESRNVRVVESMVVSLTASILIILLFLSFRDMATQRIQLYRMVNVPNLEASGIREGDTLILDLRYYDQNPVLVGQVVENRGSRELRWGEERTYGMIPEVVAGLPGDRVTLENDGIYKKEKKVYPVPGGWGEFAGEREFSVPAENYLTVPGFCASNFPGFDRMLRTKRDLGGKYLMIIEPRERRIMLP
jgi:hypothetical protein